MTVFGFCLLSLLMFTSEFPPPPKRVRQKRLTDEHKGMPPGTSIMVDRRTAMALVMYGRKNCWDIRREIQPNGEFRVWRVS